MYYVLVSTRLVVISIITPRPERELLRVAFHSTNNSDNNSNKCIAVLDSVLIHPRFQPRKGRILRES
jgi:hypothetical protein